MGGWADEGYSFLSEKAEGLDHWAHVGAERRQIANHAYEPKECRFTMWCRHLCYRRYIFCVWFHFLVWDNRTHELDLTELQRQFARVKLYHSLVTTLHESNESSFMFFLSLVKGGAFPKTKMSSALHMIPSRPSNAAVSLIWNSSGALVIPKGRQSRLHLPYVICIVVIHDDSSSWGIWRKPSLTSTREKHFAALRLWSCSFSVGIWSLGRWMALFTVLLGSLHVLDFLGGFFGLIYLNTTELAQSLWRGLLLLCIGLTPLFPSLFSLLVFYELASEQAEHSRLPGNERVGQASYPTKYETEEKISNKEFFKRKWILTPYLS